MKHRGKTALLGPHRASSPHQAPPPRGQRPRQHLTPTAPWMGKCSGQTDPPQGQASPEGPSRSPSGQLEGPARPQTPRRATPRWAFPPGRRTLYIPLCTKATSTKPETKPHLGMHPAGLGSRLVLWWVSRQTCWDKVPKDEASWDTCGFTLRRSLHPPSPQLIFRSLPTVTLYLAHEKAGDSGFASFQKYVWLIRTYFFFFNIKIF